MPPLLLSALLADYTDYRENSRMVKLLSAERGCISACVHNCRRAGTPLLAATQPLVCGEYELHESNGRYTVKACDISETFFPLRQNAERYKTGLAITALCCAAAPEGVNNHDLYALLLVALSHLAYSEQTTGDLTAYFLAQYFCVCGHSPATTRCAACNADLRAEKKLFFSPEQGGAVCQNCARLALPATPLALEALRRLMVLPAYELSRVRLRPALLGQLLRLLIAFGERNGIGTARAWELLK